MASANENIRDALLQRSIYLDHYTTGLQRQIGLMLDQTEPAVRAEIERRLGIISAAPGQYAFTADTNAQLAALAQRIQQIRGDAIDTGFQNVHADLSQLGQHEAQHTDSVFNDQSPVKLDTTLPSATQLAAIVTTVPFEGRLLKDWSSTLSDLDRQRIMDTITVGMAQGQTTDQIVRAVVGTGVMNGADGVTELTRRNAAAVVQTAVSTTANEARGAWADANSDIIGDEVWTATLDGNTCVECAGLDGQHFKVGEGPQPPAHFNCRCVRVPSLDGQVIGNRPFTSATEDQLDGLSGDERQARVAELTGQVPASMTYQDWLSQQSADFQDSVLGPARGKMFRDGNLPLTRFVNHNGDTLTLDELAQKGPGSLYVSGADTTELSLQDAIGNFDGAAQSALMDSNSRIDDLLGLDAQSQSAIGAWADGAENSIATDVASGTDYETLRAAAAMKGELGDQQSVLFFQSGEGNDALSRFTVPGSVEDVHKSLLSAGIDEHTLVPNGDSVDVAVLSKDQSLLDKLNDFGGTNGITIDTQFGTGEFVGSPLAGSDTPAAVVRADAANQYDGIIKSYLADQPPDVAAGWQRILDDWNSTKVTLPGIQAADSETAKAVTNTWIANSPVKTVDDLFANATTNDAYLKDIAATVQDATGATYKAGPIKGMARTLEKLGSKNPAGITDVVRGTFIVDSPAQADEVVAALGKKFPIADENWRFLKSGYFDRTTKVLMPDGTLAEIQLAPQSLFDAKMGPGHGLYEQFRTLEAKGLAGTPEATALNQQMFDLYTSARAKVPPQFRDALAQMEAAYRNG